MQKHRYSKTFYLISYLPFVGILNITYGINTAIIFKNEANVSIKLKYELSPIQKNVSIQNQYQELSNNVNPNKAKGRINEIRSNHSEQISLSVDPGKYDVKIFTKPLEQSKKNKQKNKYKQHNGEIHIKNNTASITFILGQNHPSEITSRIVIASQSSSCDACNKKSICCCTICIGCCIFCPLCILSTGGL